MSSRKSSATRSVGQTLTLAARIPELRRRLVVVVAVFAVYVLGLHIPLPNVDHDAVRRLVDSGGSLLGLVDLFSGGALRACTLFAMGLTPYIDASIVAQMALFAVPAWQKMVREGGEMARKEYAKKTRILAMSIAAIQSTGAVYLLHNRGALAASLPVLIVDALILTAGTAFLMWLAEIVTVKGVGNGVSLLIFCGIVVRLPVQIAGVVNGIGVGAIKPWQTVVLIALFLVSIAGIVMLSLAQRRIPIQHVRKIGLNSFPSRFGRRTEGRGGVGSVSYLPLKLNSAGVIPILFAASIQLLPATIAMFLGGQSPAAGFMRRLATWLTPGHTAISWLVYGALVMFFTYFYTAVSFNTDQVTDDLRTHGSFIPGIRPGKSTHDYLDTVLTRVTLAGAFALAAVALLQYAVPMLTNAGLSVLGGTSLLIVVGVALDTFQSIEAQLSMRHYESFIR